jgi:hypothetical protein
MSKAAVVQMTKAMALEWGRFGINVNALCPGYIDTEINHHHWGTEQGQKLVRCCRASAWASPRTWTPDRAAGQRPEPFRQRRRHRGRRRLRALSPRAWIGVAAGLAAGALWGLVFVAPRMVGHFGMVDITAARFVACSAPSRASPVFARPAAVRWPTGRQALAALGLSVLGFTATTCCWCSASAMPAPRCPASSSAPFPSG